MNIADIVGQIELQMDLYRRIQEIKKGGRAILPELDFGKDDMIGLEDLGYEKTLAGDIVPTEAKKGIFDGVFGDEKELEALRSSWGLLAGYGDVQGKAERDLRNMDAIYERESGTGNKYTVGKYGFDNFYADPTKPAETQDDNYKHISDNSGYIDVDKAIDTGFSAVDLGGAAVGLGGAAVYNWDKISRTAKSAHQYMKDTAFLSEDEVAKMFLDKDAKNIMSSIDKKMSQLRAIDKDKNPAEYRKVLTQLEDIQSSAKNKLFPKFSEELIKSKNSASADLKRAQYLLEDIKADEARALRDPDYVRKIPTTDPEYVTPKEASRLVETARKELDRITIKLNKRDSGMTNLLKNPSKWNLWKMKGGLGLRQSYRTVKDLVKIGGKTFGKLTPLDAAMWGWWIGDKAGMERISAKAATAGGAYMGARQIMNWMSKKGGVTNALMNPTLQSKIAGYLIRKAPRLALKMGLKMGVGLAGTALTAGLGTGIGVLMAAWTGKDIYNLIQDVPEIKQYVIEYLSGDYDEVGEMRKKGMTAVGTPGFLPK